MQDKVLKGMRAVGIWMVGPVVPICVLACAVVALFCKAAALRNVTTT